MGENNGTPEISRVEGPGQNVVCDLSALTIDNHKALTRNLFRGSHASPTGHGIQPVNCQKEVVVKNSAPPPQVSHAQNSFQFYLRCSHLKVFFIKGKVSPLLGAEGNKRYFRLMSVKRDQVAMFVFNNEQKAIIKTKTQW